MPGGALVYADIVQAAGAVPVDVKESNVDFAACASYKWLMGRLRAGAAVLSARPSWPYQAHSVRVRATVEFPNACLSFRSARRGRSHL